MNNCRITKGVWVLLFLVSLGLSFFLTVDLPHRDHVVPNLNKVPGWRMIVSRHGPPTYYRSDVGLVRRVDAGSQAQLDLGSLLESDQRWGLAQVSITLMGLALVLVSGSLETHVWPPIDLSFGFLGLLWANLIVLAIRWMNNKPSIVPYGYELVGSRADASWIGEAAGYLPLAIAALGLGLLLAYLFLRWGWARRADEVFP
jgi:hypothetical protein